MSIGINCLYHTLVNMQKFVFADNIIWLVLDGGVAYASIGKDGEAEFETNRNVGKYLYSLPEYSLSTEEYDRWVKALLKRHSLFHMRSGHHNYYCLEAMKKLNLIT